MADSYEKRLARAALVVEFWRGQLRTAVENGEDATEPHEQLDKAISERGRIAYQHHGWESPEAVADIDQSQAEAMQAIAGLPEARA